MEKYRSFDALAAFLDASVPEARVPAPSTAGRAPPACDRLGQQRCRRSPRRARRRAPPARCCRQVIEQQMQLMAAAARAAARRRRRPRPALPAPRGRSGTPGRRRAARPHAEPAAEAAAAPVSYDVKKAFGAIARIHTQSDGADRAAAGAPRMPSCAATSRARQESKAYTGRNRPHLADPRVVNGFRPLLKEIIYQIVDRALQGLARSGTSTATSTSTC